MATNAIVRSGRVLSETRALLSRSIPGVSVQLERHSRCHLQVVVAGPEGTPFEGGIFRLELFLPEGYPSRPPQMRFLTPIYQ